MAREGTGRRPCGADTRWEVGLSLSLVESLQAGVFLGRPLGQGPRRQPCGCDCVGRRHAFVVAGAGTTAAAGAPQARWQGPSAGSANGARQATWARAFAQACGVASAAWHGGQAMKTALRLADYEDILERPLRCGRWARVVRRRRMRLGPRIALHARLVTILGRRYHF